MEYHRKELNFIFLHDLHSGEVNDEAWYIQMMSMSTFDGRLWGDFIAIFWIWVKKWTKKNSIK
jgi:hypothetical protein